MILEWQIALCHHGFRCVWNTKQKEMSLDNKIDAVLPLVLKDYERFLILHTSMSLFFLDLSTCWIIVPDKQYNELNNKIQKLKAHFIYRIVPETKIVPEFKHYKIHGWYKQQLIKFAIAQNVTTPFYITFDADIVLIRMIKYSDLIKDNRARCSLEPAETHAGWYKNAERVLNIKRAKSSGHNVTPVLFHRQSMLNLQEYLSNLSQKKNSFYRSFLSFFYPVFLVMQHPKGIVNLTKPSLWKSQHWRCYLIRRLPWTESALYHTYMEELGEFDKYHYYGDSIYSPHSLWLKNKIKSWIPEKAFTNEEKALFLVVQSVTKIDPKLVWQKLEKHLVVK